MKRVVTAFVLTLMLCPTLAADEFWSPSEIAEIDGFSELAGLVKLAFKDAVSARPIARLRVELDDLGDFEGDQAGIVQVAAEKFTDIIDGSIGFRVTAPGYLPYRDSLQVVVGKVIVKRFVLSPDLPADQARLIVEWGNRPADLDAWLTGPGFTVSYHALRNVAGKASLDRDARRGYGPETLTLLGIKTEEDYVFSLQNYSKEASMTNVKISLYLNRSLDRVFWVNTRDTKVDLVRIRGGRAEYLVTGEGPR